MNREAILANADFFPVHLGDELEPGLSLFTDFLRSSRFTEEAIRERLQVADPYVLTPTWRELWNRYVLDRRNATDLLISVFLLNLPEHEDVLAVTVPATTLALLKDLNLLVTADDRKLVCPVSFYPVGDIYVVTDWWHEHDGGSIAPNAVMAIGRDSYGFARLAASGRGPSALDACTGSGVIALTTSRTCDRVIGVDINPRAVNFARFNAVLNGIENCTFIEGNLFDPVQGTSFDLITANPPFVASPARKLLFRDGGPTGEDVLSEIVRRSGTHLTAGGTCLIKTDLVHEVDVPYEEKLRSWLGAEGYGAVILSEPIASPYAYAIQHLGQDVFHVPRAKLFKWIDHYRDLGIRGIAHGYIMLRKTDGRSSDVRTLFIDGPFRQDAATGAVDDMLRRVEIASSRSITEVPLHADYSLGQVELIRGTAQLTPFRIPQIIVDALQRVGTGAITVQSLIDELAELGYRVGPTRQQELETMLEDLFIGGYLSVAGDEVPGDRTNRKEFRRIASVAWWSQ
jgi:methylase of polypeptide subunit release factors